ncbi:MAG TPA: 4Fe-4S binding protein [Candidatus Faecisoma merdavium]|nr:4Fe-4S binding protein [Candidatus Faecisoma merdavium]
MNDLRAVRNLRICSKDCLCLFVCPTGATDTETGQIDFEKCIGCGACSKACPSGAISMVPYKYPKQQEKDELVIEKLRRVINSKVEQEQIANYIYENSNDEKEKLLAKILMKSNRLITEDLYREAGYMLPQSSNTKKFLENLLEKDKTNKDDIEKLLKLLDFN